MSTVLQKYINSDSIKVRNDEDFEKLKEAANNLSKSVFRKKDQVIKYTLVAFDPDIDPDEPALRKVEELVEKLSPTVLSHSKDMPRTVLRAVILESLYTRAMNDPAYASIIWLTASNTINIYNLGNERQILYEMLKEIGERVEQEALKNWSELDGISELNFEKFDVKLSEIRNINSDITKFKKEFHNAFQHSAWGGENPYHHGQNNQNWPNHFTEHGGESISKLVNNSFLKCINSLESISGGLNEYLNKIQLTIEEIRKQPNKGLESVNNRSQLLWWKESNYSQSRKTSYREIKSEFLPIVMAYDLHSIVNQYYPISIDYLLKETINQLFEKTGNTISLFDYLKALNEDSFRPYIQTIISKPIDTEGRSSLLNYIYLMGNEEVDGSKELKKMLGINPNYQIGKAELAVWLFHDLQALKIALN